MIKTIRDENKEATRVRGEEHESEILNLYGLIEEKIDVNKQ
jgi:hypothetical protein